MSEQMEEFINMINSGHRPVQFEGLTGIRRLTTQDDCPEEVVDSRILCKILEMMTWENESQFQFESTWCVLNISSWEPEFSDCIIELGGLDIVINLLDSPLNELVENAVWTIRNIAAGSFEQRDICLQKDCLNKILQTLEKFPTSDGIIEHTLCGIANFFEGESSPAFEQLFSTLPVLHKYISEVHSQETLSHALRSLSFIAQENIQEIIDQGCVPFLILHLCTGSGEILAHALRTFGSLASGTHEQTNELLKFPEFLPRIFELTSNPKASLTREALWVISNITAGTPKQIDLIIKKEEYIERLKTMILFEILSVAKEAVYAIFNLFDGAEASQIHHIIEKKGIMRSFSHILTEFGNDFKQQALKVVLDALKAGEFYSGTNPHIKHVKEAGLVDIIRDLAEDSDFSTDADLILEYFSVENPEESENKIENKDKQENQENSDKEDKKDKHDFLHQLQDRRKIKIRILFE